MKPTHPVGAPLVVALLWALFGCTAPPRPNAAPESSSAQANPASSVTPESRTGTAPRAASSVQRRATITIDGLVNRLSTSHGLWINGTSPNLELPSTASPDEVLRVMLTRISFDTGAVKKFQIVEQRDVSIPPDTKAYHAVRLQSDQGDVVVLMRFDATWWTRAFQE